MVGDAINWIGGEHSFTLNFGEIEALQTATGFGLERLATRFITGDWLQMEVIETVRLGLIGGGMDAADAKKLVNGLQSSGHGLVHFKEPALIAINNALLNKPEDFLGKKVAKTEAPKPT